MVRYGSPALQFQMMLCSQIFQYCSSFFNGMAKSLTYLAMYSYTFPTCFIQRSSSPLDGWKPILNNISLHLTRQHSPEALQTINFPVDDEDIPFSTTNFRSGNYSFSCVWASKYAFPTSVIQISSWFSSAKNMAALTLCVIQHFSKHHQWVPVSAHLQAIGL